jgi:hypothetical protein
MAMASNYITKLSQPWLLSTSFSSFVVGLQVHHHTVMITAIKCMLLMSELVSPYALAIM